MSPFDNSVVGTPTTDFFIGLGMLALLVLGSARIARLVIFDSYPPAAWLRTKWDDWTHESGWNPLLHCAYCLAPWVLLVNGVIGLITDWNVWWALPNAWLGLSYLAATYVAYDGDDD